MSQLTTTVNAVSDNINIINCAIWPKERAEGLLANGAPYQLIKNTALKYDILLLLNTNSINKAERGSENKIYREKSISMTALWRPAFSNHGFYGNTSTYYSYYFDFLLSLLFKGSCGTLGLYFR